MSRASRLDRSIIQFFKLQSVGRFQLRVNVVAPARDTARGLMRGLYFSSWKRTGEPQPPIILINDES